MWSERQSIGSTFFFCVPRQIIPKQIIYGEERAMTFCIMEQKRQQIVYFNSRDRLIRLDTREIVYFEADGNYTYIVTVNKQKACLTMNLSHTEEALATQLESVANQFMRIGKRFVVNMNYIYQIDIQKQVLLLSDWKRFAFQLPVSKEALKSVKDLIIKIKI